MAELDAAAERCGYAGYVEKYLTYPPQGLLPLPGDPEPGDNDSCNVWEMIHQASRIVNPGFNYYRIFDGVRIPRETFQRTSAY